MAGEELMQEFKELLLKLGFTEEEAKSYLNLVEKADGEVVERVYEVFEVSEDEARDILASLVRKGAVFVEHNRVKAAAPRDFVYKLLENRKRELEKAFGEVDRAATELLRGLEPIYWEKRLGIKAEDLLEPLEDLKAMELRTTQIINRAMKEVRILAGRFDWYPRVREVLFAAHDRKVSIKVLLSTINDANQAIVKELKDMKAEVKKLPDEWYPIRGTLCDGKELVFLIWATKKDVKLPIYYRPSYTKNEGLISIFMDAFEKKWHESTPV